MPLYRFVAVAPDGERVESTKSARGKEEVLELIRAGNLYPISVSEVVEEKRSVNLMGHFRKIKTRDMALFCRQFNTMLRAGVVILSCLEVLSKQTENKQLGAVIEDVLEQVQKGQTLSEAMRGHPRVFPELLVNMIAVGEVSGSLDLVMDRMATHFEKEHKINSKVKNALVYPVFLGIVAIGIVVFLLTFVMPTFISMFEGSGVELPLATRIMLGISYVLSHYGLVIIAIIGLISYGVRRFFRTEPGRLLWDGFVLKVPVVKGAVQKVYTSRVTRTLSTLITSGIPLIGALDVTSRVAGNKLVEAALKDAAEDVKRGINLSSPIRDCKLFPPMVHYMINIGEESGALDDLLDRTATFYDDEVEIALTRMIALMEPVMILVMALLVGGIAISMILPMFKMIQTIKT